MILSTSNTPKTKDAFPLLPSLLVECKIPQWDWSGRERDTRERGREKQIMKLPWPNKSRANECSFRENVSLNNAEQKKKNNCRILCQGKSYVMTERGLQAIFVQIFCCENYIIWIKPLGILRISWLKIWWYKWTNGWILISSWNNIGIIDNNSRLIIRFNKLWFNYDNIRL